MMIKDPYSLEEVDRLMKDFERVDYIKWMLVPKPISRVTRKRLGEIIRGKRIRLTHERWADALEAVRELSDTGGVEEVIIYRIWHKQKMNKNSRWVDGKQDTSFREES